MPSITSNLYRLTSQREEKEVGTKAVGWSQYLCSIGTGNKREINVLEVPGVVTKYHNRPTCLSNCSVVIPIAGDKFRALRNNREITFCQIVSLLNFCDGSYSFTCFIERQRTP